MGSEMCIRDRNIPAMRFNQMSEVLDDAHLNAVGFFAQRDHPKAGAYRSMKHPVSFSATPASVDRDPPQLGADTDMILAALGLS